MKKIDELLEKLNLKEDVISDLEKKFSIKIKPGRNTIGGFPVDIEDQDPDGGISLTAVDKDAAKGLAKLLKSKGVKTKSSGKDLLITS